MTFGDGPFDDFLIHPTKLVVRFKRADGAEGKALVDWDKFDAANDRSVREFGDPSKNIGGPVIPVEQPKRRKAA